MNVLVLGKGGREHAIALALANSQSVSQVYALPGNPGMLPKVEVLSHLKLNIEDTLNACEKHKIDLVVIGPEDPLVAGMADALREKEVAVFGPDKRGAQLEGSKIYAKEFMEKYQIPTAPWRKVSSVAETLELSENFTAPYVLKADGLAAGKGVFICPTVDDLKEAAIDIFEKKSLGEMGAFALLEQFQPGFELSFFILTNGKDFVPLPLAQDHKRLSDGDKGPNTGGMGTVAPMQISDELYDQIISQVVKPTVAGLTAQNFDYCGVVFIGIMATDKGPQVLEYNVRFGDPETQVLLPLLDGDWGEAFLSIAKGEIPQLKWTDQSAACVVLAAENYPSSPVKGVPIEGDWEATTKQYFLHAGTDFQEGRWQTAGGRVLNAIGLGSDLSTAIDNAYKQSIKVQWPGMQKRSDIGQKAKDI